MLAVLLPELRDDEMFVLPNIGVALALFLAGGCLTGQLSHHAGPRRRLWLVATNALQTALVVGAAAVQYAYGVRLDHPSTLAVLAMLAFASGSQVVQSRSLAMPEISTAMATAAWVDLMMDPALLKRNNRSRTRRVLFLGALALGALLGAFLYQSIGSAGALMVSAGFKALVTLMYLFSQAERKKQEHDVETV
jgi:uncharacterized membrane protein YoaK (UPF0700 family)